MKDSETVDYTADLHLATPTKRRKGKARGAEMTRKRRKDLLCSRSGRYFDYFEIN